MKTFEAIDIAVPVMPCVRAPTHNALPLLHEIRHALQRLLETGEETAIDLQSLPLAPADESELFEFLGTGEVEAHLDALGASSIRETRFPGVWIIEHSSADDAPLGKYVEVTYIPAILKSQTEDVRAGAAKLASVLAEARDNTES